MAKHRDIEDMIEILTIAAVRQETEEQFFRRSANASSNEVAKSLFSEIADDLNKYVKNLEERKNKLLDALKQLQEEEQTTTSDKSGTKEMDVQRDPVCGMKVDKDKCQLVSTHKGKEYRFCSVDCQRAFDIKPEKYLNRE